MYVRYFIAGLVIGALSVANVDSARILALFPTPSRSHLISSDALTRELASRGHHVTVISSYPQEKAPENYTDIAVPLNRYGMDKNMFNIKVWDMIKAMTTMGSDLCDHFLGDPGVQKLIHSKEETFDLVLIGLMFNECLLGFVHKYKAPVIAISSNGGMPQMHDIVGNPTPYAYVPNILHTFTDHMTFKQRVINTFSSTVSKALKDFIMMPQHDAKMREYFREYEPIPHIAEIERGTSMLFFNSHYSIGHSRPFLPNVIEVGGMHIRPSKKLPKDVQTFLDSAKDGAIYFSLGSNLKVSQVSEDKMEALIKVFAGLKEKVLWKSDLESIDGLPPNVKLGKWLPQLDILAHKNVKLFITHGGLLSTQEAIYHQVPVVGIPIFGDQQMNIQNAVNAGYALCVQYTNITEESITWAVRTMLNDPSYEENIKKLSSRFRDQQLSPLERAVFWTEYVIRHKGAYHMRSASMDLAWYQYFLLDVLAFFGLILALVSLVVYKLVKTIACLLRKKTTSKKSDSKEKKMS